MGALVTIQCRNSRLVGMAGEGASGSLRTRVYLLSDFSFSGSILDSTVPTRSVTCKARCPLN